MIAAWMLYCTAVSILLICAAMPVERFVQNRGGATRRVWFGTLLGACVLPVLAVLLRDGAPAVEVGNEVVPTSLTSGVVMGQVQALAGLDTILAGLWLGGSALVLGLVAFGLAGTWKKSRDWSRRSVDGVDVLVSRDVGPAVVGLLRARIVLPAWALDLAAPQREMMLRHEQEHVAAGDPRLVLCGALVAAAFPWNPGVWFMLRRLRLSVEVDCDRRVVRGGNMDLRGYAELLLTVGSRRSVPAYGVGFSVGRPFLEERIDRMTLPTGGRSRAHTALLLLGVGGVLAAVWTLPQPVRAAAIAETIEWCETDDSTITRGLLRAYDWST